MRVRIAGVVLVVLALAVAAPAVAHAGSLSHFRSALMHRINHYRSVHGRHSLRIKIHLSNAAQAHSGDMAKHHMLSHSASSGVSWITRIRYWGYRGTYIGEDLAVGDMTAKGFMRMWRASPPHRANLLSGHFRAVGLGVARGTWGGRAGLYVTADFGGNY
jgi:uncharacterized protein YkwD